MTTITPTKSISLYNQSRKRMLLLLCIVIFPLLFSSILFGVITYVGDVNLKVIGNRTDYAYIKSPKNRSIVNEKFEISGSLATPKTNHTYYLVEFREKRYWPKFALGNKPIKWRKDLTNRAKKNKYVTYQVVMADPTLTKIFDDWFKNAAKTGKYPGISKIKPNHVVASIKVKTQ